MDARIVEAMLASHVVGIGMFDGELRCLRINGELARVAARAPERLIGRTLHDILGPERAAQVAEMSAVVTTGVAVRAKSVEAAGLQLRVDYLPLASTPGRIDGLLIVAVDMTAQRRAESALAERLAIAELISELSATLIDLDPTETAHGLARAVHAIGARLGIEATRVSLFSDDATRVTHAWVRPGVTSPADLKDAEPPSLPWAAARVLAGRPVVIDARDELPPEAAAERQMCLTNGIEALVLMPLAARGAIIGHIDFSSPRRRNWTPEVLASLRLTAELVASALDRQESDNALRERLLFDEALSSMATRFVAASADAIDGAIVEALRTMSETMRYERASLFVFDDARSELSLQHEWCAPGMSAGDRSPLTLAAFGWPLEDIAAGKVVDARADSVPPAAVQARALFERDNLAAWTTVPVRLEEQVIGCVAFAARQPRVSSEAAVARLRLVGDTIASALARQRAERARRSAFAELERLKNKAERERDYLREEAGSNTEIIGGSLPLLQLIETIEVVAATGATVLIRGESGTGKELIARAIHERSPRRSGPLVKVNCASVPKELFESEFFGHVRGAFTGAFKDRAGRFELADGGTLFLDEIGDIPFDLQAKLLRVLQESEFERVGDDRTRKVDVRIVAATNRDLEADVVAGRFRQDLYYRLSVFPLEVPSLRERRDDVVPLAEHFLRVSAAKLGRSQLAFDETQRRLLTAYDWPGNVRELQHVIERAVILSVQPPLQLERALQVGAAIPVSVRPGAPAATAPAAPPPTATTNAAAVTAPSSPSSLSSPSSSGASGATPILTEADLRALERDSIVAALERAAGRIAGPGGAAELLGVRPSTLRDRMKALRIQRPA